MTRLAFIIALLFAAPWEEDESVDVRYLGPVTFNPSTARTSPGATYRAGLLRRDEPDMVIRRNAAYDQYCELPKGVVTGF